MRVVDRMEGAEVGALLLLRGWPAVVSSLAAADLLLPMVPALVVVAAPPSLAALAASAVARLAALVPAVVLVAACAPAELPVKTNRRRPNRRPTTRTMQQQRAYLQGSRLASVRPLPALASVIPNRPNCRRPIRRQQQALERVTASRLSQAAGVASAQSLSARPGRRAAPPPSPPSDRPQRHPTRCSPCDARYPAPSRRRSSPFPPRS